MSVKRIVFHVGGPDFHPVSTQAQRTIEWLGPEYEYSVCDGLSAFESLDDCDLLVLMGLH